MEYIIRKPELKDAEQIIEHKEIVTEEYPDTLATPIEDRGIPLEKQEDNITSLSKEDLVIAAYIIYRLRFKISRNTGRVSLVFLFISVSQRVMINSWYLINDDYSLSYSLPFQICRVVIWLIIIQFFFRKDFLNQAIFYIGLFASAAFIYPIGIHPVWHMAGSAFFILHAANVLFPLAMHFAMGFVPTLKGVFQAYVIFSCYFTFVYFLNTYVSGNYFFINNRPFFHDMDETLYVTVNLAGTFIGFMTVYLIIRLISLFRKKSLMRQEKHE